MHANAEQQNSCGIFSIKKYFAPWAFVSWRVSSTLEKLWPLLRGRLIGRTPDFESGYRGSSPRPGAISSLPSVAVFQNQKILSDQAGILEVCFAAQTLTARAPRHLAREDLDQM